MAKVIKQNTPLVAQPLKTSSGTGAVLATLGFKASIPLMHGSQGCSAFTKTFLIQHLREPIPIQNTAIDHVAAVMGGDDNLDEALVELCEKHCPEVIGVMTTGLTEMQGTDIFRAIANFRRNHPQYASVRLVSMSTPDFVGSMQTGFATAADSVVRQLVQPPARRITQRKQVNVLCSIGLTSADVENIKRYLEAFELDAVVVPDISCSIDGHLADALYSPTSTGGTSVLEVELMSESVLTIVIGQSMINTAKWLEKRFEIPYRYFGMGMKPGQVDDFVSTLTTISEKPVPGWISHARRRLQDAMVDSHFVLTDETFSIALEPDLAVGYADLLTGMGVHIGQVVTTVFSPELEGIETESVIIGDLSALDLDYPQLSAVISNTHAAHICEPRIPVLRAGYPCHDRYGNMDVRQFGYEGIRERIFALSNIMMSHHHEEVEPHISAYHFEASDTIPTEPAEAL